MTAAHRVRWGNENGYDPPTAAVAGPVAPALAAGGPVLNGMPHVGHDVFPALPLAQNMDRHTEQTHPTSVVALWQKHEAR